MDEASFREANLHHADFSNCSLRKANFTGADLHDADLTDADLRGAAFMEADLSSTKLLGAKFEGAVYTQDTKWPSDFNPDEHRLRKVNRRVQKKPEASEPTDVWEINAME
jgi:uncharacterized protein YjbI with pentapeptide repeats